MRLTDNETMRTKAKAIDDRFPEYLGAPISGTWSRPMATIYELDRKSKIARGIYVRLFSGKIEATVIREYDEIPVREYGIKKDLLDNLHSGNFYCED